MKFVLVHGGWQGGWVWHRVRAMLAAHGHDAYPPTLLGMAHLGAARGGIGLSDMAEDLLFRIKQHDLDDFVLVGHSGGGAIAQYVADRMPDQVRRIVFISAWVLRDGESIADLRPKDMVDEFRRQAAHSGDNTIPMTESLWRTTFMQDGTADELDLAVRRLLPTPFGWFDEKIHLPRFFDLDLPSSYIFPRQDIAIPREQAEQMAARLADPRLVACEGGHQAMQSRPRHLTDALIAASEEKN